MQSWWVGQRRTRVDQGRGVECAGQWWEMMRSYYSLFVSACVFVCCWLCFVYVCDCYISELGTVALPVLLLSKCK